MEDGLMRKVVALIPSRLKSRRLPNKSLKLIGNLPLVIHTYRRVKMAKKIDDAYICCDSPSVMKIAKKYNAKAILTSKKHKCGTDRIFEALKRLKKKNFSQIINVQGDEPLIDPLNIDKVINFHRKFKKYDIVLPNLPTKFKKNFNIVKIIFNKKREILFLTRAVAPHQFRKNTETIFKHLSIISFTPSSLEKYARAKRTKLEIIEDVELLRAIDIGLKIKTFSLKGDSFSVDVKENLIEARKKMNSDKYYKLYGNQ